MKRRTCGLVLFFPHIAFLWPPRLPANLKNYICRTNSAATIKVKFSRNRDLLNVFLKRILRMTLMAVVYCERWQNVDRVQNHKSHNVQTLERVVWCRWGSHGRFDEVRRDFGIYANLNFVVWLDCRWQAISMEHSVGRPTFTYIVHLDVQFEWVSLNCFALWAEVYAFKSGE